MRNVSAAIKALRADKVRLQITNTPNAEPEKYPAPGRQLWNYPVQPRIVTRRTPRVATTAPCWLAEIARLKREAWVVSER